LAVKENALDHLRLTRNQLYERVGLTPIVHLVEVLGITNFLLSGIGRKHEIPTPPAGYWSKIAHDKRTSRPAPTGETGWPIWPCREARREVRVRQSAWALTEPFLTTHAGRSMIEIEALEIPLLEADDGE